MKIESHQLKHQKILVGLPGRLGDTLFCTPSLRLIKNQLPNVILDAIVLTPLAESTLENNPNVNSVFVSPTKKQCESFNDQYDYFINAHNSSDMQAIAENINLPTFTEPPRDMTKHQSQQIFEFMQTLFGGDIGLSERRYTTHPEKSHYDFVDGLLSDNRIAIDSNTQIMGVHLGCHSVAKRGFKFWKRLKHRNTWEVNRYCELIHRLNAALPNLKIVLTGSKSEEVLAKKVLKSCPGVVSLINQTSVLELAALMDRFSVYLTPDTGVMHVACSREIPIVALFGPASVTRTGPYPPRSNITVVKEESMDDIRVNQVYDAVLLALKQNETSTTTSRTLEPA